MFRYTLLRIPSWYEARNSLRWYFYRVLVIFWGCPSSSRHKVLFPGTRIGICDWLEERARRLDEANTPETYENT